MAKQSDSAGVFLQTKSGLIPFAGLTVCNLGSDAGLFYAAVMHGGKEVVRVSGTTTDAAMKAARQVVDDVAKRIDNSDKSARLVIEL